MKSKKRWYKRVGPGLITASVVVGPGSILVSSQAGSSFGYSLSWVVILAALLMMNFTAISSKLAVVSERTMASLIRDHISPILSVFIGICIFFISTSFQVGNNIGLRSSIAPYVGDALYRADLAVISLNLIAMSFHFFFKKFYVVLERLMMICVGVMILSFAANLVVARPDVGSIMTGMIPDVGSFFDNTLSIRLFTTIALMGTTLVISASFFQAYLAQQKGWKKRNLIDGILDVRIAAAIMASITLMIMWTGATVLRGEQVINISIIASQLEPLFGGWGQSIFSVGLFSAAFSSFLVNSLIGGFILSDCLGFGSRPKDMGPKVGSIAVLLTGCAIAQYIVATGREPLAAIRAAQAVTVIAAPLVATTLWWLSSRKAIMGDDRNSITTNVVSGIGVIALLVMSGQTLMILANL